MQEAGVRADVLSGTSVGALNAAALAVGLDAADLAAVWTSLREPQVFRFRDDLWNLVDPALLFAADGGAAVAARITRAVGWPWLLDTAPLRRTLLRVFGGERIVLRDDFVLVVTALRMASGQLVHFTSTPPPRADRRFQVVDFTVDHLLASAAIPLLFRPGAVGGVQYWDGGIVANTPLKPALAYEPDAAIVVMTSALPGAGPGPAPMAPGLGLLDSLLPPALVADFGLGGSRQDSRPGESEGAPVPLLVVEPPGLGFGPALDFRPERARQLIELGREAGARAIAGWHLPGGLL
jgi:NTE family protein